MGLIKSDKILRTEPVHPNIDKLAQLIGKSHNKDKVEKLLFNLILETHPAKLI